MKNVLCAGEDRRQVLLDFKYRHSPNSSKVRPLYFLVTLLVLFAVPLQAENPGKVDFADRRTIEATILPPAQFDWVDIAPNQGNGSCLSGTDCCSDVICFGLQYTPGVTGEVTSYTTGFFIDCVTGMSPLVFNESCTMEDNSMSINGCMGADSVLFNSSGHEGALPVTAGVSVILHQVCFSLSAGQSITIDEDEVTDLTLSIDLAGGGQVDEFPAYTTSTISWPVQSWPADQSTTIACVSAAIEPSVPAVFDLCGNPISAVLLSTLDVPAVITCEGFRVYVFQYTDCSGNTHLWNYYYFIEYVPFTVPPDGGVTVACLSDVDVNMIIPPAVSDNCGTMITPLGPSMPVYDPPAFTCDGTVTYTWQYTDCEGNTQFWDYVFTVDQVVSPAEVGGPVSSGSTIACGLDGVPPVVLPVVVDACGNTIPAPAPVTGGTYTGGCDGTITYTYTYSNCPGLDFVWTYTYMVECSQITLKVFLEGPYSVTGDSMLPTLNVNHVLPGQDKLLSPSPSVVLSAPFTPFGQPYTIGPWNYAGNTGLNFGDPSAPGAPMGVVPYPADVVDWILVTIRENGILPTNNIWTCAGWVHTDGEVTFPESCAPLSLDIMDDYHVLIQHRNHLGVLSPTFADMPCASAVIAWDFTTANAYEPIFRTGQIEVEPGIWAMIAANGEQIISIEGIESGDRTKWRMLQNVLGYSVGDYNMDVSTNSNDETVWKFNQNKSSGIIFY
jgi:hypothetical protein